MHRDGAVDTKRINMKEKINQIIEKATKRLGCGGLTQKHHCQIIKDIIDQTLQAHKESWELLSKDGPCYFCGRPTNSFTGDHGEWPIYLCHSDSPGIPKPHHESCVSYRLEEYLKYRKMAGI